jgi:biopolymer transport protein ExbB/biopolymer transport protein TolQ
MEFSVGGIWAHMGLFARLIVITMGLMSVASFAVIAERALFFTRSLNESRAFAGKMGAMLAKGDLAKAAGAKLGDEIGYLGRVIRAGLQAYKTTSVLTTGGAGHRDGKQATVGSDLVFESVARALERQAARETQVLKRGVAVLATVASTAPFIGLFGTVIGIINAFNSMAATGSGGLGTVSAGIAEALGTTAVGLFVAIVAVVAYNVLQGWVDARAVDVSEASNELLDVVARSLAGVPGGDTGAEAAE